VTEPTLVANTATIVQSLASIYELENLSLECSVSYDTVFEKYFSKDHKRTYGVKYGQSSQLRCGVLIHLGAMTAYTRSKCLDTCSAITFQAMVSGREHERLVAHQSVSQMGGRIWVGEWKLLVDIRHSYCRTVRQAMYNSLKCTNSVIIRFGGVSEY
jgi:hypothetical protein